ncbi:MAG: DNA mismatch repair protein MutS [Gemmatimonadetes bacterium]|nr:DNA mismatch repair protein MutS [Gemmatimonadota bacterium]NNM06604.1 DNA mismatch repair protein MutS [Gemmatimonadota bacterium]
MPPSSPTEDTPLMQQWREVKSRHRDALVFFRVGDFYELFFGDAEEGSRILGLTLTSRNNGAAARVPLAGIPVKALDEYLGRLVKLGRRVAICEQVEDPAQAKGIVKREVVETLTPGTIVQDHLLQAKRNNHLVSVASLAEGGCGLASLDLSTGVLEVQKVGVAELEDELGRLEPSELLVARTHAEELEHTLAEYEGTLPLTIRDDWLFDEKLAREEVERTFGVHSLEGLGFLETDGALIRSTGALLAYVHEIRPGGATHLSPPRILRSGSSMLLDDMTRRNLELVESIRPGEGGTLLDVLDETVTAMGARLLRKWILRPLVQAPGIWERQEAVQEVFSEPSIRRELREGSRGISDLERLAGKIGTGRVGPRDLLGLARSLARLPQFQEIGERVETPFLSSLLREMDLLADLKELLEAGISPETPPTLQDGGVIRTGFDPELDELRTVRDGARDFIASLQARERERTGIGSLKVGFNRVFGYYLEVTKANLAKVPDEYVRKQTLANAERYFTPELKEWEEKVFGAEERIQKLETEIFGRLRNEVASEISRIQDTADRVAKLDVLVTFAEVAQGRGYVRPEVHTGFEIEIRGGRHPVVETMMPREEFIPNDLAMDEDGRIIILTGPNMAGKSTVLRQIGLIQLLAQVGAFVPAAAARIPVCDRIFTRVGASDSLARGQSTFMVEMNETAAIVHSATETSLVLLDEIGRGTSTYDGVSIAWAVTEHLHEWVGAKTIFATHYHELTQLGDLLPKVRNLNVAVREVGDGIVFLRRLEDGGADRSYGIQVARLAGLPSELLERARELLEELEGTHSGGGQGLGRGGDHRPASEPPPHQLSLFAQEHPVVSRIRELEVEGLTPLEALNVLADMKAQVGGKTKKEE